MPLIKSLSIFLLALTLALAPSLRADTNSFPVKIHVDAAKPLGDLHSFWRFFGADEPNYATNHDGAKLIGELGALDSNHVYFRAHNLLTSGDGTPAYKWGSTGAYREDAQGHPFYDWTILDHIFDTYRDRGVRPYVEIGFMPRDLSIHPDPYQHNWQPDNNANLFTGWTYPPKDYQKWGDLVYEWTRHCVQKYGRAEVENWYWEVWNEANIGYWKGTPEEFRKLHDYAIDAVRRALPTARVGGADSAGPGGIFTRDFLEHCLRGTNYATGKIGTPLDFVSFHAKGSPSLADGHVRMGIANQLRDIDNGCATYASYPELKDKPIIVGESDPDTCAGCDSDVPKNAKYAYRNTTLYSSYTAESFAREHEIAAQHGVNLEGVLTWAFEFEGQPYFEGFRTLASNGLDKPVLNVFRMFSHMSGTRLTTESDHAVPLDDILRSGVRGEPDVSALASLDQHKLCVMVWYYHDDDLTGPDADVELTLQNLPIANGPAKLAHYRIDEDHSNSFATWKKMGSPQKPTPEQYAQLEQAGHLAALAEPATLNIAASTATIHLTVPRQGVSLLELAW